MTGDSNQGSGFFDDELSELQVSVIALLVGGATLTAAAEKAGVNRSTVYRWQEDSRFIEALKEAKREYRARIRGELRTVVSLAVEVLRDAMTGAIQPSLRIKTATDILKIVGIGGRARG